jgi:hypothetical protein
MAKMTRLRIAKGDIVYFIKIDNGKDYSLERISIRISLTLDTYRPSLHPFNLINLLSKTDEGYDFLRK